VIVTPRLLRESPPVTLRSGQEAAIRSLLEPGQRLSRDGFVLRWSGAPEGSTYTVQVVTANLDSLDEARGLAAAEYRVPPEKLSGLPAGAQVLWRVEARGPDGAHLDSATFAAVVE
jgi:hypothetical protein